MAPEANSTIAHRYRTVASAFTRVASAVTDSGWAQPSPCKGWTARDIVYHLVTWVPEFFASSTIAGANSSEIVARLAGGEALIDHDPAAAWTRFSDGVQSLLDDPAMASLELVHPRVGAHRIDDAVGTFVLGDVLIHTWDLARSTHQQVTLDASEVTRMLAAAEPLDEILRAGGQYGPRVFVDAGADAQTKLLGFMGRKP
jgi:uncharacterized protein (TIGR03086 family)